MLTVSEKNRMTEIEKVMNWGDLTEQEVKPRHKKPNMYKVILLNDDFTPMDFVVGVLMNFFNKTQEMATMIMLQVHKEGKGICGVYTSDVAETKVAQVNDYARSNQYPLLCSMEIA
jgi:ATP-dependent Clp protease adaptor protein ClpS